MTNLERAKQVFEESTGLVVSDVSHLGAGVNHSVYSISSTNRNYVVRFSTSEGNAELRILRHIFALGKWKEVGVPVPEILETGADFCIETYIPGIAFGNALRAPENNPSDLFTELGELMKRMHSAQLDKYQTFGKILAGGFKSWEEYLRKHFPSRLTEARALKFLDEDILVNVETTFQEDTFRTVAVPAALIHADPHFGNILVHKSRISGFIDAESCMAGDGHYDLAYVLQKGYRIPNHQEFLRSYGNIDPTRLRQNGLLIALSKLNHSVRTNASEDRLRKDVGSLNYFLSLQ